MGEGILADNLTATFCAIAIEVFYCCNENLLVLLVYFYVSCCSQTLYLKATYIDTALNCSVGALHYLLSNLIVSIPAWAMLVNPSSDNSNVAM